MPYDPIEQEIINALTNFPSIADGRYGKYRYNDKNWTNGIKAIFSVLGHTRNYQSYSGFYTNSQYTSDQIREHIQKMLGLPVPNYLGEWLYDILWWEQRFEQPGDYVIDIPLVAESEWGSEHDVKVDFHRLLLARSKYRVMIFQCGRNIIQWFKAQIQQFKLTQSGDRYLFCSYEVNRRFYFELYIVPDLESEKRAREDRIIEQNDRFVYLDGSREYYSSLFTPKLDELWSNREELEPDEVEILRRVIRKMKGID